MFLFEKIIRRPLISYTITTDEKYGKNIVNKSQKKKNRFILYILYFN